MPALAEARRFAAANGWLSATPPAFQERVLERTALRSLKAGAVLDFRGDDAIGMYGITAGRLRVELSAPDHGPYLVHIFRPGAWLGEGPSIVGRPRIATSSAAIDSVLLFLPRAAIHEIVKNEPAYWRFFYLPLLGHLEVSTGVIVDLLQRDHTRRIIASLLRLGGVRTAAAKRRDRIEIEASQEEIAIMANVARTTAGSVLRKLAKAGLVSVGYGQVTLLAPARLRATIGE